MRDRSSFPAHGYAGIMILVAAEILLLLDFRPVSSFFTPIVWTGYILLADAWLALKRQGAFIQSWNARFPALCVYSILFWVIFEYYNLILQNWYYKNLPVSYSVRMFGYLWSFATILPGILVTSELLKLLPWVSCISRRRIIVNSKLLDRCFFSGILLLLLPLVFPSPYVFAPVWIGAIFLLEPLNYRLGKLSLLRDLEKGEWTNFYAVLLGGYVCGLLWEFWNYWAFTKWIYTVPILPQIRIFEMPVLGFLGFGPFALECYVAVNLWFDRAENTLGEVTAIQT
jgi:hypothetical protein